MTTICENWLVLSGRRSIAHGRFRICLFFPGGGGQIKRLNLGMLLSLLVYALLFSNHILAQGQGDPLPCVSIEDCKRNLSLEVVREIPSGTSPSCATWPCGQVLYHVYLKYSGAAAQNNPNGFELNYGHLFAEFELEGGLKSHIDVAATEACYQNGTGANWNQNVIFKVTPRTGSIDFHDTGAQPGCNEAKERLTFGPLSNTGSSGCQGLSAGGSCQFAKLFTLVVNAQPGELIRLQLKESLFEPPSGLGPIQAEICGDIYQEHNGNSNGLNNYLVPYAAQAGANSGLLLEISGATLVPDPDKIADEVQLAVFVRNTGTSAQTITAADFGVLMTSTFQIDAQKISYVGTPAYVSAETGANNPLYLRFVSRPIAPIVVPPGGIAEFSIIKIKEPLPRNKYWLATFDPSPSSDTRIETANGCTQIAINPQGAMYSRQGKIDCPSYGISFAVRPRDGNYGTLCTPSQSAIQIGFQSPPGTELTISKLEFGVIFETKGTAAFTGAIDLSTWEGFDCGSTCLASSNCVEFNQGKTMLRLCIDGTLVLKGSRFITLPITGSGCISVRIVDLYLKPQGETSCVPPSFDLINICSPQVEGVVQTESGGLVNEVSILIEKIATCPATCPPVNQLTNTQGKYGHCLDCAGCVQYVVTPEKTDNPLNGVTTLDLAIISKHILGVAMLPSPYKIIAADANKSGTITTFDVVELRKLILAIYNELPNNKSWRFVEKNHVFQDPLDPFMPSFPESKSVASGLSAQQADFIGIKIGDVNGSAVPQRTPIMTPTMTLSWASTSKDGIVTVPIRYTGDQSMECFQMGLHFDPAYLSYFGALPGDLPSWSEKGNLGLTRLGDGEIRALWLPSDFNDPAQRIRPGQTLFHLAFRVKKAWPSGAALPLWLDDTVLPSRTWTEQEVEHPLRQDEAIGERAEPITQIALQAACHPNPSSGAVRFDIAVEASCKGRLALFDALGRRIFVRDLLLEAGTQTVQVQETAGLAEGLYRWKVYANGQQVQGQLALIGTGK